MLLRNRYRDAVDGKFRSGPDRGVMTGGFPDAFAGQRAAAGAARPVLVEDLSRWLAVGVELPARFDGQPGRQPQERRRRRNDLTRAQEGVAPAAGDETFGVEPGLFLSGEAAFPGCEDPDGDLFASEVFEQWGERPRACFQQLSQQDTYFA